MNSSWIVLSWQWSCGKEECIAWSIGDGDCGPRSFLSWVREPVVVGKMLKMRWESIFWLQKGLRWGHGWVRMLGQWPVAVKIYLFGRREFPSLTERAGGWESTALIFLFRPPSCLCRWMSIFIFVAGINPYESSEGNPHPHPSSSPEQGAVWKNLKNSPGCSNKIVQRNHWVFLGLEKGQRYYVPPSGSLYEEAMPQMSRSVCVGARGANEHSGGNRGQCHLSRALAPPF